MLKELSKDSVVLATLVLSWSMCLCWIALACSGLVVRLKKIQEKKKQQRERTELEIAARLAKLGPVAEPSNMLTDETDEDMLFE